MQKKQMVAATTLQRWWKKNTGSRRLHSVCHILQTILTPHLQDISNKCHAIQQGCKGDGAGLTGGTLIDMFLSQTFRSLIPNEYEEFHEGENDMKIAGIPLSQKKIYGKSTIALDWSKNPNTGNVKKRDYFTSDILIINLKIEQWWKKKRSDGKKVNEIIPSGLYLIDKAYCKHFVTLTSNNKTNTLIDAHQLYRMLQRSRQQQCFVEMPAPNQTLRFNLCDSFESV